MKGKLIRITTVPQSLHTLLRGQLKFMSQYYKVLGISSYGEALEKVRLNEGIDVIPVKMTRTISPVRDLVALWNLLRIMKKEKPLIVHTHTPKAGTLGMIAAKFAGVPIRLHTIAGLPLLETKGLKRLLLDMVEKITYACATRVYPNSQGLYNIVIENHYVSRKKLKVLNNGSSNGIDTCYFAPENIANGIKDELKIKLNISTVDFVFIFIGRLVKAKGINELVSAFIRLNEEYKNIKLIMLGSFETHLDPLKDKTISEIEQNDSIIYAGYQNDVRPYLAISDVLVFPTYREGFPNVVMQAGAMGLPAIVSDINGCNEIIINDENGIIIPAKNVELLYRAMRRFMCDRRLQKRMKENARQLILLRYDQQKIWDAILKEYKECENNNFII